MRQGNTPTVLINVKNHSGQFPHAEASSRLADARARWTRASARKEGPAAARPTTWPAGPSLLCFSRCRQCRFRAHVMCRRTVFCVVADPTPRDPLLGTPLDVVLFVKATRPVATSPSMRCPHSPWGLGDGRLGPLANR